MNKTNSGSASSRSKNNKSNSDSANKSKNNRSDKNNKSRSINNKSDKNNNLVSKDKLDRTFRHGKTAHKIVFDKPGNFLYPIPAVMVSCGSMEEPNIITIAWTGTICSDPPMVSISVRPERYSHDIIKESGEFVINLTTKALTKACDYCGVKSGRDVDKFADMHLTPAESKVVACPSIEESPVSIECKVKQVIPLGTHDMFIAEVVSVSVDSAFIDSKGRFQMNKTDLICYSHGEYMSLGKRLGTFGFSVRKKQTSKKKSAKKRR